MDYLTTALLIIGGIIFLCLFLKIFSKPVKWVFKLLFNALIGFTALALINFLGNFVGLHITVGWISALVAGLLGFPGIVLLLLIENLFL